MPFAKILVRIKSWIWTKNEIIWWWRQTWDALTRNNSITWTMFPTVSHHHGQICNICCTGIIVLIVSKIFWKHYTPVLNKHFSDKLFRIASVKCIVKVVFNLYPSIRPNPSPKKSFSLHEVQHNINLSELTFLTSYPITTATLHIRTQCFLRSIVKN